MSISKLMRRPVLLAALTLVAAGTALAQDRPDPARPASPPPGGGVAPATPATPTTPTTGGGPAVGKAPPARAHANFSGTWRMDPKASDDPSKLSPMPGNGPGGGPGRGPGRGNRGPAVDPNAGKMPGEGFDGSDRPEKERHEAEGRRTGREFGRLEIFHDGDEFDLTDGMQVSRVLKIGGQPTEVFTPRGSMKAAAAWEGEALVVTESNPEGRVMRTRQFMLSADRQVLTVREVRHMPGKDGDLAMTVVYRREQPGARPDDDHAPDDGRQGDGRGDKRGR